MSDYARSGHEVVPPQRMVHVTSIRVCHFAPPLFTLRVQCRSGLYVRSLVHDIGQGLFEPLLVVICALPHSPCSLSFPLLSLMCV